jgi:hypothetical protein
MSLLRLLAAGKSLVGMRDAETRYRVTGQRLLPQFGSGRNPFSNREKAEAVQTGPRSPGAHEPKGVPEAKRSNPVTSGEREAALRRRLEGRTTPPSPGSRSPEGRLRRRAGALLAGWKTKLVGLLAKRRCEVTKTAIPRFTKPPVQGELSLDRIKVVRNDLSDADLEVIPAKPPPAPGTRAVEMAASAENAWGRVAARVFGAGKT